MSILRPISFERIIAVSSTPADAFRALTTGYSKWWTSGCGSIAEVGDRITFRFGEAFWVMQATILNSDFIELECVDAHHVDSGLPPTILKEWEGTKLQWSIHRHGEGTQIAFTHEGLNTSLLCYRTCEQGWDHFFVGSLKKYLNDGVGTPFIHAE
ncbi:MAG: SRPBCC domain-containing protein [Planctomycetes bacterium]|nr:SRPBCC domain-containing protein [Planctomycetota bacterium]